MTALNQWQKSSVRSLNVRSLSEAACQMESKPANKSVRSDMSHYSLGC